MFDSGNSNAVLENRENLTAMQALWCEVLASAWHEVFHDKQVGRKFKRWVDTSPSAARNWFGSRDFREVCAMAGVDDDAVLDEFNKRVGAGI